MSKRHIVGNHMPWLIYAIKKGSGTLTTKRIEKYQEQNFRVILQILTCDSSKSLLVSPKYVVLNCMQSSNNQSEYELIKKLYTQNEAVPQSNLLAHKSNKFRMKEYLTQQTYTACSYKI